jgi:hypothetical protein
VRTGDTLVVYGLERGVCELDERPRGPSGDEAHEVAVTAHLETWADELRDATEDELDVPVV